MSLKPMTFTELVAIFDRSRYLFLGTMFVTILVGIGAYQFQPVFYTNELILSVTRTSVTPTQEYSYDHFYRLQADERIAESLSQYLGSETGKRTVAERAKLSTEAYRTYTNARPKVVRLGTNIIKLQYKTRDVSEGVLLGEAIVAGANEYVFSLNEDARQKEWFTVIGEKPVTKSALWSLSRVVPVVTGVGLFVAFWAVLINYFWRNYQKHKRETVGQERA